MTDLQRNLRDKSTDDAEIDAVLREIYAIIPEKKSFTVKELLTTKFKELPKKVWVKKLADAAFNDVADTCYYHEDYAKSFVPVKKLTERDLINLESRVGSQIFGQVPKGHRREFFNLNKNTWIWHESWTDEYGKEKSMTVRYNVTEKGVIKVQAKNKLTYIVGEELDNFYKATKEYLRQVAAHVYRRVIA